MNLSIRSAHVQALVSEAARRTGQTQTKIIERALEQYLRSLGDPTTQQQRVDELISEMSERISNTGGPLNTETIYDGAGLPA
ncbi:MAG: type II toxin-antitoxin system VapB family antitoxin [Ancrocorticia sp.]|uniref:type II toxin-antitoxin system VapB family antitoxin n=1 Tax=Ancrocorticia sp. TaxID=2593684 RepID=UPI003F9125D5